MAVGEARDGGFVSGELGGCLAPRRVCGGRGASRSARRFRPRRLFFCNSFIFLLENPVHSFIYNSTVAIIFRRCGLASACGRLRLRLRLRLAPPPPLPPSPPRPPPDTPPLPSHLSACTHDGRGGASLRAAGLHRHVSMEVKAERPVGDLSSAHGGSLRRGSRHRANQERSTEHDGDGRTPRGVRHRNDTQRVNLGHPRIFRVH